MKRIFKISAILFCAVFVLSGCKGTGKASYSDNSLNINIGSEESISQEPSGDESSDENVSSKDASSKDASSRGTQSENASSQEKPEENTSSDTFPAPAVKGGTVIGTTSKGYEIKVKNGITYINGVLIVNKTYALPGNYNPGLQSLSNKAFNKMKAAAKKDGISIWISSGFRSYKSQKSLYESYCNRDGAAAADRYSARPGHSEHQSGLAIDVNSGSTAAYETTYKKVGEWLKEHCFEYGFIIRYPEGKESITGYKSEPWHIRYVGTDLALLLKESGQTLEEYFGITSYYTSTDEDEENDSSAGSEGDSGSSDDSEESSSSEDSGENNESSKDREENESSSDT